MADFRRVVTALAVVVMLMGLASTAYAQATGPAFSCTASAAVPPLLRAEGLTELTGDIVLNCTGGTATPVGGAIQFANITMFLGNTTVTSRILDTATNASDALLLIDEPNTPLGGNAPFVICGTPLTGCTPYIAGGTIPNVYRGLVSGNSVTFIGVPINPPGSVGTRIFRITNVRANASTVGAGPAGTPGQVQAFVSISGPTSIPINNPTQVVGFVQNGLVFTAQRTADLTLALQGNISFPQCTSLGATAAGGYTPRAVLRFRENFATAFKTRTVAGTGVGVQDVPGSVYNTESGLIMTGIGSAAGSFVTYTAGLADFGTRLRATFNNIPTGVTVYVSVGNIASNAALSAVLVGSETGAYFPVTPTAKHYALGGTVNNTDVAPVTLDSSGRGTAVWEVTGSSSLSTDNYDFLVYYSFAANPGANSPAPNVQATVAGSFAPAPPAIDATAGARASATLPIPRFIDSGTARNLFIISICRTILLFPFVTNQAGFDTGWAVSNTTRDPFATVSQSGICTWNFYGDNAPSAVNTAALAGGEHTVALASSVAPNFQGYMIAVCNFQLGHGFAFVSDIGARNLAMGYLALVIPDNPPRTIPAPGESLGM